MVTALRRAPLTVRGMRTDRTLIPSVVLATLAAIAITLAPQLTDRPAAERPQAAAGERP